MNLRPSAVPAVRPPRDELDDLLPAFDASGRAVHPHGPWRDIDPARQQRDREIVTAAISRLPEPYQTINRLHDGLGMSKDVIARQLDLPRDEVARLLHRARCALVTMLDPHFRKSSDVAPSK
ncbi:MAG: sigma factor-like helix-turn-helix DNA-binding protein [Phycisphaerales bacterium]